MATNFPENKYMISVVEPINRFSRREPLRVEIYERLDTSGRDSPVGGAQHVRFIGDFALYDPENKRYLSLEEVTEKIYNIIKTEK